MVERPQFDQFDAKEARSLIRVRMLADTDLPNWPGVIELAFDEFAVFVCVETEFDTLLCTRALPESYGRSHTVVMPATFWCPVIGWTLTDAWQMRNDRGYLDAIQLRFREHPNEGSYRHIQLWAICSSILLQEFKVLREEPPEGTPAGP
jgi:hypothetical protein